MAENGWRPIETAKHRIKLLGGFFNELGKWRTITIRYYPARTLESEEADDGYAPEGWYETSETQDVILPCKPTHWMPLPEPPAPPADAFGRGE